MSVSHGTLLLYREKSVSAFISAEGPFFKISLQKLDGIFFVNMLKNRKKIPKNLKNSRKISKLIS